MTADAPPGPFAFTLEPAEIDAVAARYGLRQALGDGLTVRHHAPLAAFALTLLFAAILGKTDLIGRRAAEAAMLLAAMAFMIQRLWTHRRIWRARSRARAEVERLLANRALTATIEDAAVREGGGPAPRRMRLADCREAEEAGGLVYLWSGTGAPIVLPGRILADGDAARVVAWLRDRIQGAAARA